ncbi:MAG: N-acetylmuramoyl-L-alanine amidase [Verrucomicrobiae bacterium]|nr:N-acetylmuramoyl-L-alanine amidase [Verrucomicrobiae bacterium]
MSHWLWRIITRWLISCAVWVWLPVVFAQPPEMRGRRVGEREYVAVSEVRRVYGLRSDQLVVRAQRREIELDGVQHWLSLPVVETGGQLWMARVDVLKTVDPVARAGQFRRLAPARVVMLDAGHGGTDRGARSASGRTEKELTLDVAQRVERYLKGSGLHVVLTRRRDVTVSLSRRTAMARERRADLFVSIHFNSAMGSAHGIETFCLPPRGLPPTAVAEARRVDHEPQSGNRFDAENVWLAHLIQKQLLQATGAVDRGVRRARFQVLRDAPCPAVLVECGFLSYRPEAARIATVEYREQLARAIAEGIRRYAQSRGAAS